MKQIFISYSRKEKLFATRFHKDLEFRGLSAWIDLRDIPAGKQWSQEIEQAIMECSVFLLLLSPNSVTSDYVRAEYTFALDKGKPIVPLLLEPCDIPDRIAEFQYIDMRDYRAGLARLIRELPVKPSGDDLTIDQMITYLQGSNKDIRLTVLNRIGRHKLYEALDAVVTVLKDPDAGIRERAAWVLDKLNDPKAIPALLDALYDPFFPVRSNAGWALVHLGAQVVPAVAEILGTSANEDVRQMVYLVLSRIGGREAQEAIKKYVQ